MALECPWHPSQPATVRRPTPSGKARRLSQASKSRTSPRSCHVASTRGCDGGADTGRGPRPLLPGATGRMGRRPASMRQVSTEAAARLDASPSRQVAHRSEVLCLPATDWSADRVQPPMARGREPRARAARDKRVAVIPLYPPLPTASRYQPAGSLRRVTAQSCTNGWLVGCSRGHYPPGVGNSADRGSRDTAPTEVYGPPIWAAGNGATALMLGLSREKAPV